MQVNNVIQTPNSTSSVGDRERLESRTVSPQAPVDPNATPSRPVSQVNGVEGLSDENMVNVEQAREVFAREVGQGGSRAPENPITGPDEARQVAASLREQVQSDAGAALRAQASRTPVDSGGLLRSP